LPSAESREKFYAADRDDSMICKDDEVCLSCFRRRKKKDCGCEPKGWGPDLDGEFSIGCAGQVSHNTIIDANLNDVLMDYHGIGDPIPLDLLFPILIWSGFNWLNHPEAWRWYDESL
jgi:hypothetical protein